MSDIFIYKLETNEIDNQKNILAKLLPDSKMLNDGFEKNTTGLVRTEQIKLIKLLLIIGSKQSKKLN